MTAPDWLNRIMSVLRERARSLRAPVPWHGPASGRRDVPDTLVVDRHGNRTVRVREQVTTLHAADAAGRDWIILEIVPLEPAAGYERTRTVRGRARYELKDGTPVTRRSETTFEVKGAGLTITQA